ncbi:hypothetical protein BDV93DRAFT_514011 [Ceratobasidium sp. AG-I]|nr:hypothetical protein BDV93DRAFT_514011 [Ceratobasidium sp. AG-I]
MYINVCFGWNNTKLAGRELYEGEVVAPVVANNPLAGRRLSPTDMQMLQRLIGEAPHVDNAWTPDSNNTVTLEGLTQDEKDKDLIKAKVVRKVGKWSHTDTS